MVSGKNEKHILPDYITLDSQLTGVNRDLFNEDMGEKVTFLSSELNIIWNNINSRDKRDYHTKSHIGQKCFKAYHGRYEPCPNCPIVEVIQSGIPYNGVQKAPDGTWLKVSGIPINNESENLLGVLYLSFDITRQKLAEEALLKSEKEFRAIFELASVGIVQANPNNGQFTNCNQKFCEITGYTKKELFKLNFYELTHPDDREEDWRKFTAAVRSNTNSYKNEKRYIRKDGSVIWIRINAAFIRNPDGEAYATVAICEDITERFESEEELRKSKMLLVKSEELSRVGGWAWDVAREEMIWTDQTYRIHEIDPDEVKPLDKGYIEISSACYKPEDRKKILKAFKDCAEKGIPYDFEVPFTSCKGREMWVKTTAEAEYSKGKITRVIGNIMDITERKHFEETLEYMSFHDQLTGLYNRRFIEVEIKRLDTARQLPLAVIVTDLNNLKLANDVFGHAVGDKLIKAAARVLKSSCRDEDIVARWGGDEFAILLPQTTKKDAETIYNRIIERCSVVHVAEMPLSMAIGLSVKTEPEQKTDDLIKEAETNMYKNKLEQSRTAVDRIGKTLLKTLADKSCETENHIRGIQDIAGKLAEKMGLSSVEMSRLKLLAVLHDIGKVGTTAEILTKEGPLSDAEWEKVKEHPEIGFRIAKAVKEFSQVAEEILSHHEYWDGSGYPRGLKGEEIPVLARIIAVADAYEVMTSGRPYKEAMTRDEILSEFQKCSGSQFNSELVEILMQVFIENEK
ncbi:MAG: PAS domain S-box protein [Firmicutes bacterium]|nr:PAS domain S-box protein [Bacillota bacterium]